MSTQTSSRTILLRGLIAAFIVLLLILLWKQQADLARLKEHYAQLQEQHLGLLNNSLQPQPVAASNATPTPLPTPGSPTRTMGVEEPLPHPPPPDINRLIYTGTEVNQTATGLVATLRFKASKKGPLGLVGMSVKLPGPTDAVLQSIKPVGAASYEEGESTVSENGRFAFFQGTARDESDVQIALGVSSPARVYIKGNRGIGFFLLDIQSTNATAIKQ